MKYEKIGVFLSANADVPPSYRAAAEAVGTWIGQQGRTLVYGGAGKGLMEVLAQATRRSGGRVFGVVPQILVERDAVSDALDVTFRTADLHDRKAQLLALSDVLVALPGGVGTLDEIFTALSMRSIGLAAPPILLFDVEGCWQPLLALLRALHARGLLRDEPQQLLSVVSTIQQLEATLGSM